MRACARELVFPAVIGALLQFVPTPAAGQWRPNGVPVASTGYQDLPRVAPDGAGGLYVVWRDYRDYATNDADVYLQRLTGDGFVAPGWPALGVPVAASIQPEHVGRVAPDGAGGALVTWVQLTSVASHQDIFAQRILADGSIAPGWSLTGVPVCLAPGQQSLGDIVGDGLGGAYLAWTDYQNGDNGLAVYTSRITADGRLADGWTPDGTLLVDLPGTRHTPFLLADPSGDAFVVWGDSRLGSSLGGTFFATRLTPSGQVAPGWPAHGVPLFLSGTGQEYKSIVSDGAGGAFIGWNDNRQGGGSRPPPYDYDIYAQHLLADGRIDLRWPRDGYAVCAAPGAQYAFTMAADGTGGALFAWEDLRGSYWQAFAQRVQVDATLAPGWPTNGVLLSSLVGNQLSPRVVGDGVGGLYAFWVQYPNNDDEVVGQHLLASGQRASGWLEEGLTIGAGAGELYYDPAPTSDGTGGALLAFTHGALSGFLINAQRVNLDGPVATRPSLLDSEVSEDGVTLRWQSADAADLRSTVERRHEDSEEWSIRGTPVLEGTDVLRYTDREVAPGRYAYHLRYFDGQTERFSEDVSVEILATVRLALEGFRPNPSIGPARVTFALPDDRPASLQILDLRGRRLIAREVGSFGPGSHAIQLDPGGSLASGVYWIRLVHPGRTLTTRGVITR